MKKLKSGYTTGTCATACVKAALYKVLNIKDENIKNIEVEALSGEILNIPIKNKRKKKFCNCSCRKIFW